MIKITWIVKLKVDETVFEVGKDKIEHIKVDNIRGLIEIKYELGSEWSKRVISIHSVDSICYKEKGIVPHIYPGV